MRLARRLTARLLLLGFGPSWHHVVDCARVWFGGPSEWIDRRGDHCTDEWLPTTAAQQFRTMCQWFSGVLGATGGQALKFSHQQFVELAEASAQVFLIVDQCR